MKLTKLFNDFFDSERSAGLLLIACTAFSLFISNSGLGEHYLHFWHINIFYKSMEFWINDGLMTIFFLLVGLEIEREIYIGELSSIKKAMLPVFAAVGGMLLPAGIHFAFNHGTAYQNGYGIPMATDIAFSLAILSLLGKRVPASLKIFLTALAIIDDLGAIMIIAFFYSKGFSLLYLTGAGLAFLIMLVLNRLKYYKILPYLILGLFMWFFMYRSGIHPTISGVLLAFAIPFGAGNEQSISIKLQHRLHKPVAFFILPLFALANTAIVLQFSFLKELVNTNSLGIILGLVVGKPLGILIFSIIGAAIGACVFPKDLNKKQIFYTGLIAGIGFTMSIFITLLAFPGGLIIDTSKIAVLVGSLFAGILGYFGLKRSLWKSLG